MTLYSYHCRDARSHEHDEHVTLGRLAPLEHVTAPTQVVEHPRPARALGAQEAQQQFVTRLLRHSGSTRGQRGGGAAAQGTRQG